VQQRLLFSAEQGLLPVRLAADSGARRGELAVLRLGDIEGRVLTIERGLSRGVLGSTKSERTRRLTLGSTTTSIISSHYSSWIERGVCPESDWLFAPTPMRARFMTADALSHKFRRLGTSTGVTNPALHRLRHGVATYLVDQGKLSQGTGSPRPQRPVDDASTLFTHEALDDQDVADELDAVLNGA
jgi:integrase